MLPAVEICESARLSRDPRFDGCFFVAVVTTGIYCRPICPARSPAPENVRYFANAAAAQDAGYRPCLRCRPERASVLPEWTLGSATVIRGLRLISSGFLSDHSVPQLAADLGISSRHLARLFVQELGTTPGSIVRAQRQQLAKRLLDETDLRISEVALLAGYGSLRRFNDEISSLYGRTPSQLRRYRQGAGRVNGAQAAAPVLTLQVPVRQPYDQAWVFSFLQRRALAPLERVQGTSWYRRLGPAADDWLRIRWQQQAKRQCCLQLQVPLGVARELPQLLSRVRNVFDLDTDSATIDGVLAQDGFLADRIRRKGGIRVPGAWNGFELGVRAILGQQVSVSRATQLGMLLSQRYGEKGQFPSAEILAAHNVSKLGMPRRRGAAIQHLALAVSKGDLCLEPGVNAVELRRALRLIPGIGPWTAEYIAMRAGRDPDAFPEQDWVVLRRLNTTVAGARKRAEAWRPWRSYALMYLWSLDEGAPVQPIEQEKVHV